ncbi:MAG TPA: hypothetical protein VK586_08230, partial [Streptosporangiaceae bacterium]|nr:hypothetical protein [Streptosporangiaceae bacterium]
VRVLAEDLDATLARGAGVNLLLITSDGIDALHAARNAIASAESLIPQIKFLYLDRDLVGISEIAERTGRSRQNVAQWVRGERHATASEPFPRVEGVVGRARIWLWSEVNAWVRMLGFGDEIASPRGRDITNIDFLILHKDFLASNRSRAEVVWPPVHMETPRSIEMLRSDPGSCLRSVNVTLARAAVTGWVVEATSTVFLSAPS